MPLIEVNVHLNVCVSGRHHFRANKSVDVLYLNVQGKNLISAIDATELKKRYNIVG